MLSLRSTSRALWESLRRACLVARGGLGRGAHSQCLRERVGSLSAMYRTMRAQEICTGWRMQMLECLKGVHGCGYLHRDVKPANFVRRKKNGKEFVIIDFGEEEQKQPGRPYRNMSVPVHAPVSREKAKNKKSDASSEPFSSQPVLTRGVFVVAIEPAPWLQKLSLLPESAPTSVFFVLF